MTFKGIGTDWQEHRAQCEAANLRFNNMEITVTEYRKLLADLGFNATEIDIEVENNKP